jgi:uncharacterized membrane protein YdbT with pleckstrin-like domain
MSNNNSEQIEWYGKPSKLFWFKQYLIAVSFLIFAVLSWWISSHYSMSSNQILQYFTPSLAKRFSFVFISIALGILGYLQIVRWSAGRYKVTSQRISEQRGLISNYLNEVRINDIRGTNIRQTVLHRILGIGSVEISSAADGIEDVKFIGVRNPNKIRELIHSLQK